MDMEEEEKWKRKRNECWGCMRSGKSKRKKFDLDMEEKWKRKRK
jgi:hypothetical protein